MKERCCGRTILEVVEDKWKVTGARVSDTQGKRKKREKERSGEDSGENSRLILPYIDYCLNTPVILDVCEQAPPFEQVLNKKKKHRNKETQERVTQKARRKPAPPFVVQE